MIEMENATEIKKSTFYMQRFLLILSILTSIVSLIYVILDEVGEHRKNWLIVFTMITVHIFIEILSYIAIAFQKKAISAISPEPSDRQQPETNCCENCLNSCKLEFSIILNFSIWMTLFYLSIFKFSYTFSQDKLHETIVFSCVATYIKLRAALELCGFITLFIKTKGRILCIVLIPVVELFKKLCKRKHLIEADGESLNKSDKYEIGEGEKTECNTPEFRNGYLEIDHSRNNSSYTITFRN